MSAISLPTFFLIGASKSGTTSLNHYLGTHPEIAMAEPQEPHQLLGPNYEGRLGNYGALYTCDARLRGETSSGYANYPYNAEIVDRIADTVPDARLLYLVRDPVDRTIAHYAQHIIKGDEHRSLEEALAPPSPDNYYVAASRYGTQVERYLRRFGEERILVIDHVELRDQRRQALCQVFAHVGADPEFWDEAFAVEHNVRAGENPENVRLNVVGRTLRDSKLNAISRRALPEPLRRAGLKWVRKGMGQQVLPETSPQLHELLAEALAPEVERLRELTGQQFGTWSL